MHRIRIQFLRRVNWSLLRAGIPVLLPVEFETVHGGPVPLRLRIWVDDYLDSDWVDLPGPLPGTTRKVDIAIRPDFLRALDLPAKISTLLRVCLNEHEQSVPIEVLAPNEWHAGALNDEVEYAHCDMEFPAAGGSAPQISYIRQAVSPPPQTGIWAFVSPDGEFTRQTKSRAVEYLQFARPNFKSLHEFLAVEPEYERFEAQKLCVQALCEAIRKRYPGLIHDLPPVSFELESQRVRLTEEIMGGENDIPMGTCVDLAVMVLSAMEALGLSQLLFVLIRTGPNAGHALVGYYSNPVLSYSAVIRDRALITRELEANRLRVIDVVEFFKTGLLESAYEAGKKACLNLCYAVVLRRPPCPGGVAPLSFAIRRGLVHTPMELIHPLLPALHYQPSSHLQELCRFWREPGGGVMELVGVGGSGKTSLVYRFLELLPHSGIGEPAQKDTSLPPPDRLLVWSFSESRDCRSPVDWLAKVRAAGGRRILAILDALEQVQSDGRAAAFGAILSECQPLRLDLQRLTQRREGVWVVVTSQIGISELAGPGLRHALVDDLDVTAARSLLRECGVLGGDEELDRLVAEYGKHALTLDLIATLLCTWFGGDSARTAEIIEMLKGIHILVDAGPEGAQAARLAQVLCAYEKKLNALDRQVLGAVLSSGSALDAPTIMQWLPGSSTVEVFASLARLTGLFLLKKLGMPGRPPRYLAHPLVTTFFQEARLIDLQRGFPLPEGERQFARRGGNFQALPSQVRMRRAPRISGAFNPRTVIPL